MKAVGYAGSRSAENVLMKGYVRRIERIVGVICMKSEVKKEIQTYIRYANGNDL